MKALIACAALASLLITAAPSQDEAPVPPNAPVPEATRTLDGILDALYDAVSFGPGGGPDWESFHALLLDGAVFVQPPRGDAPHVVLDTAGFVADFERFVATSSVSETGFDERIAHRRTDLFGRVAHAYVVFEARLDRHSEQPVSRGLDSIQLVQHGGRWWIVSITTEFERPGRPFPERFLGGGAR